MAETPTVQSSPPSPSTPAAGASEANSSSSQPPTPPAAAERKPTLDPSEAGRILARARGRSGIAAKEAAAAAPKADASSGATSTNGAAAKTAEPSAASNDGSKPPEAKPDEKKPSDDAEAAGRLAQLVQGDKRLKAERAAFESERASWEVERRVVEAFRASKGKGPMDQLQALGYTPEQIRDEVFWGLVQAIPSPKPVDPATIPDLVKEQVDAKLKEKETATSEAQIQQAVADMEAGSSAMAESAGAVLAANADKYPLVSRKGISAGWEAKDGKISPAGAMDKFIIAYERAHPGEMPSSTQILDHFEVQYAREYEEAGYVRKPAEQAPAAPPGFTVTQSAQRDSRAANGSPVAGLDLEAKREAVKQRLKQMRAS